MASGLIQGGVVSDPLLGGRFLPPVQIFLTGGITAKAVLLDGFDFPPEIRSRVVLGGAVDSLRLISGGIDVTSLLGGTMPTANKSGTQTGTADTGSITGGGFLSRAAECRVQTGREQLRAIQDRLTEIENGLRTLLEQPFAANAVADVQAACRLLPRLNASSFFDFSDLSSVEQEGGILGQFLCDEGGKFEDLDPRVKLAIMADNSTDAANCILGSFERFLRSRTSFPVVKIGFQVLREVKRAGPSASEREALECLSKAVENLAPGGEFIAGPFQDFLDLLSQQPIGKGRIPRVFSDPEVQELLDAVDECEVRIETVREAQNAKQRRDLPIGA